MEYALVDGDEVEDLGDSPISTPHLREARIQAMQPRPETKVSLKSDARGKWGPLSDALGRSTIQARLTSQSCLKNCRAAASKANSASYLHRRRAARPSTLCRLYSPRRWLRRRRMCDELKTGYRR